MNERIVLRPGLCGNVVGQVGTAGVAQDFGVHALAASHFHHIDLAAVGRHAGLREAAFGVGARQHRFLATAGRNQAHRAVGRGVDQLAAVRYHAGLAGLHLRRNARGPVVCVDPVQAPGTIRVLRQEAHALRQPHCGLRQGRGYRCGQHHRTE